MNPFKLSGYRRINRMKFEKYKTKNDKIKWHFYHYFGINLDTEKAYGIRCRGFNTQSNPREALM